MHAHPSYANLVVAGTETATNLSCSLLSFSKCLTLGWAERGRGGIVQAASLRGYASDAISCDVVVVVEGDGEYAAL